MSLNCLIVAGEKSGEEHALSFLPSLKKSLPGISFYGVGGDELKHHGVELIYHLKDFSSFGISEVIFKIPFYFRAMSRILSLVKERETKVAILIDFQDFNFRLAKRLKARGVFVFYYVAPQAWAWRENRAKLLEERVHTLFTILPFEKKWFSDRGVKRVHSVDHPLVAHYGELLKSSNHHTEKSHFKKRLLILPGSRKSEVSRLLPLFSKSAMALQKSFQLELILVKSSSVDAEIFAPYENQFSRIYTNEQIAEALLESDLALAASGTVTLLCALFQVPTVVSYQGSLLNEFIFYTFIKYSGFVSLANIVHGEELFPELLQESATPFNMERRLAHWLSDEKEYEKIKSKLAKTLPLIKGSDRPVGEYLANTIKEIYEKTHF